MKPKILLPELFKVIKFELKKKNAFRNIFITHNAFGMLSPASHINTHKNTGQEKVKYNSLESAKKAAEKMTEKRGVHFSYYKCAYCTGYHVGINQSSREKDL